MQCFNEMKCSKMDPNKHSINLFFSPLSFKTLVSFGLSSISWTVLALWVRLRIWGMIFYAVGNRKVLNKQVIWPGMTFEKWIWPHFVGWIGPGRGRDEKLTWAAIVIISVSDNRKTTSGLWQWKGGRCHCVEIIAEVVQVIQCMWQERRRCQKWLWKFGSYWPQGSWY